MPDRKLAKEILLVVTGQKAFHKYIQTARSDVNSTVFPPLNQEYPKQERLWVVDQPWETPSQILD